MNQVNILGNLTRDPEVSYTPKGTAVCNLGVANNRVTFDEQGNKREEVTFLDVTAWGKQAENCGKYLNKGSKVLIQGRLKTDSWDDKQTGQKRYKLVIVAEQITFIGSKPKDGEEPRKPAASNQQRPAQGQRPQNQRPAPSQNDDFGEGPITEGGGDDDIPF